MNTQIAIDFSGKRPPDVQHRIAQGMAAADAHADDKWKHLIDGCVLAAARKKPQITTDDVWDEIDAVNESRKVLGLELISTHKNCAIGPAMLRAAQKDIVASTDGFMRSHRAVKHGNLSRVWRSKLYGGNQ